VMDAVELRLGVAHLAVHLDWDEISDFGLRPLPQRGLADAKIFHSLLAREIGLIVLASLLLQIFLLRQLRPRHLYQLTRECLEVLARHVEGEVSPLIAHQREEFYVIHKVVFCFLCDWLCLFVV